VPGFVIPSTNYIVITLRSFSAEFCKTSISLEPLLFFLLLFAQPYCECFALFKVDGLCGVAGRFLGRGDAFPLSAFFCRLKDFVIIIVLGSMDSSC
jgi:hypothetical protein